MKPLVALAAMALLMAACVDGPTNETGDANYDALKWLSGKCAAEGAALVLKDGGNSRLIQDYTCKRT